MFIVNFSHKDGDIQKNQEAASLPMTKQIGK